MVSGANWERMKDSFAGICTPMSPQATHTVFYSSDVGEHEIIVVPNTSGSFAAVS